MSIKEIMDRWKAATPGPWCRDRFGIWTDDNQPGVSASKIAQVADKARLKIMENDAEAIAHAPEDIAELLELVGECNKLIDTMQVTIDNDDGFTRFHPDKPTLVARAQDLLAKLEGIDAD